MSIAVVYYSLEGNTRMTAQKISDRLGADLIELKPVKSYPTGKVSKFFWGGKSTVFKEMPDLEKYDFNSGKYDTVIVGNPLWAWSVTPPLRTFLAQNDLCGKKIAAFISCGGGDAGKAFESIRELAGTDKLIAEMKLVNPLEHRGDIDAEIDKFCEKIKNCS